MKRAYIVCLIAVLSAVQLIQQAHSQAFNPTILQDTRDLPKTDGTFGFLYRTEDGIAHAAKADTAGIVHGRYTYTDPTGLKVNFNYNAGSRVTPGYNYDDQVVPNQPQRQPQYQPEYQQEQPRQQPRQRSQQRPIYQRNQPRARPRSRNELYDNYEN